jgi:hypothetical protein
MSASPRILAAAAAITSLAAPAAAQYPYPYPQPYPQTYPGYPYGQQPYGGTVIDQVIGQLLGNRYNVTDRTAISRCASAAMVQAQSQYRGYGAYGQQPYGYGQQPYGGYGQPYGYGQGIAAPAMRVTAITDVQRRSNGLRVRGLIDSGHGGYGAYGGQYGYQNRGYATGDLTFRCNVDYRGYVTNVRIGRNDAYRRY